LADELAEARVRMQPFERRFERNRADGRDVVERAFQPQKRIVGIVQRRVDRRNVVRRHVLPSRQFQHARKLRTGLAATARKGECLANETVPSRSPYRPAVHFSKDFLISAGGQERAHEKAACEIEALVQGEDLPQRLDGVVIPACMEKGQRPCRAYAESVWLEVHRSIKRRKRMIELPAIGIEDSAVEICGCVVRIELECARVFAFCSIQIMVANHLDLTERYVCGRKRRI
jgi:ribosomal protein S27AE